MDRLFKCSVCGFVHEGNAPEICPKCGYGNEKYEELSPEAAEKVYRSDKTNTIHMEIITLISKVIELSQEGIEDNLDAKCVSALKQTKNEAWIIKRRLMAELAGHVNAGKW